MPKKIVFCADGTWNHPQDPTGLAAKNTNVVKLYHLAQQSPTQSTLYDDGVGADNLKVLGGAFAVGLFNKVKQGYKQIAANYQKGDRLYLFGFSRGAYTARSLAGMITLCGLPTQGDPGDAADKAFDYYQGVLLRNELKKTLDPFAMDIPTIAMQGMWDTVGALGITGPLLGIKDPAVYGFLDTNMHDNTEAAYHALAIDERRAEFKPTLWTLSGAPGQVLNQVWFTGVHSEVGGGSDEVGLSDITLSWMLRNAKACGMELTATADTFSSIDPKHALDTMKDSWNLLWAFPIRRSIPANANIASSVAIRLAEEPTYRPPNLKLDPTGKLDPGYSQENVFTQAQVAGV
jgi:uncharacterized protein (DUF2235 family)